MMPLHVFSPTLNQMHVVVVSESVFHVENLLYPPDISFSAFVMWCTLSVSPLLVPRTFIHKSKSKYLLIQERTGRICCSRDTQHLRCQGQQMGGSVSKMHQ